MLTEYKVNGRKRGLMLTWGPHVTGKMGLGGPDLMGAPKFYDSGPF